MNKQYRYIVAAIVTLIAASLAYLFFTRQTSAPPSTTNPPSTISNDLQRVRTTPPPTTGSYISYDPEKVASTTGTKLLFFHAPWCPQCRDLEASINKEGIPEGVTIFKVDYDSNQALRQQYGVTIQTTVVKIDDEGNELDSFVAYDSPSIEAVQRELLQ